MPEKKPAKPYVSYTDGGARGNPGPAGLGVVLINSTTGEKEHHKKYLGTTTNNQAEYQALVAAIERLVELGATHVTCYLDSELIVKQMKREYKVKNKDLAPLFMKIWNLREHFMHIEWVHIPREKNKEADKLVNKAIDEGLQSR